jgi:deoxyribodipyrimidine photolyase-related protein
MPNNHRMPRALQGLGRLADIEAVIEQEQHRGTKAP